MYLQIGARGGQIGRVDPFGQHAHNRRQVITSPAAFLWQLVRGEGNVSFSGVTGTVDVLLVRVHSKRCRGWHGITLLRRDGYVSLGSGLVPDIAKRLAVYDVSRLAAAAWPPSPHP